MLLTYRLNEIYSHLIGDGLCDVGCDHGKLCVKAKLDGFKRVVATDISEPSLNKAIELAKSCGVEIEAVCTDGLSGVELDGIDNVVIAGMGGLEIINILTNAPSRVKNYVLSPNTKNVELRKYLLENGYGIKRDYTIEDAKFYTIIVCGDYPKVDYSDAEIEFGKEYLSCSASLKRLEKEYLTLKPVGVRLTNSERFSLLEELFNETKRT